MSLRPMIVPWCIVRVVYNVGGVYVCCMSRAGGLRLWPDVAALYGTTLVVYMFDVCPTCGIIRRQWYICLLCATCRWAPPQDSLTRCYGTVWYDIGDMYVSCMSDMWHCIIQCWQHICWHSAPSSQSLQPGIVALYGTMSVAYLHVVYHIPNVKTHIVIPWC